METENKVLPGMAKKMFIKELTEAIVMHTYDPSMKPATLVENTITAYQKVSRIMELMELSTPKHVEEFDVIAHTIACNMKELVKMMEGE